MKRVFALATAFVTGLALMSSAPAGDKLEIGDSMPLPHVKMTNVDGTELNLREAMKPGGLVVIFSCNTCPFVIEWEETYNDINAVASANEVGMILVNSNEAKRDGDDSMKEMMEHAKAQKYSMPYVVDKDHVIADAFGANTTPHVYFFDKNMTLVYTGAIDDRYENSAKEVTQSYLTDAIQAYMGDGTIDPETTQNKGCSIKRVKQ
jgi:peroxiredoxin